MPSVPEVRNPYGVEEAGLSLAMLEEAALLAVAVSFLAAVASVLLCWHGAHDVERQQIKWLTFGAASAVALYFGAAGADSLFSLPPLIIHISYGLAVRLRDEIDLHPLTDELSGVVQRVMEPTTVALWLRPTARLKS